MDGLFFIQTMEPLLDREGWVLGYFESVFQLSAERSGEIVKDIAMMVAVSSLSVLAAALLLLPIFVAFNRGVMGLSRRLLDANIDILTVLGSAIAKRDSDTHAHNYRVTILAIRLAEAMDLDAASIRRLVKGAFLHDVGKIAIPDHILLKPGKLDADEFAVMKTHVVRGWTSCTRRRGWRTPPTWWAAIMRSSTDPATRRASPAAPSRPSPASSPSPMCSTP